MEEIEKYLKLTEFKDKPPSRPLPSSSSYRTTRKELAVTLIDEAHSLDYTYNHRGSIIFQNNVFLKGHGSAKKNTYTWRCQRTNAPTKCPVLLRTLGKRIVSVHGEHTHSEKTKEAGVKAKIFKDF
jgi:FLYWCH zinc finger domain